MWYKKGIFFKCKKCCNCCTGFPGYVWLNKKEIENIHKFLKISKEEFLKKYTRHIFTKISLKEILPSYDCIFLKDKKCQIYEVRPKQCRTYPFWPQNLKSKQAWKDLVEKNCPGTLEKKQKYTFEEIEEILKNS